MYQPMKMVIYRVCVNLCLFLCAAIHWSIKEVSIFVLLYVFSMIIKGSGESTCMRRLDSVIACE